jgi:hypothetical protein
MWACEDGATPLSSAARCEGKLEAVRALLELGANADSDSGARALRETKSDEVKALLRAQVGKALRSCCRRARWLPAPPCARSAPAASQTTRVKPPCILSCSDRACCSVRGRVARRRLSGRRRHLSESNASIDDEAVRRQSLAVPAECQFQAKQVYEGQRDRGQALGGTAGTAAIREDTALIRV